MPEITLVNTPMPISSTTSNASDARSRAIQQLMGSTPAVDQNNVSAEEMGAIKAPSQGQDSGQNDTSEASQASKSEDPPLSQQYAVLARKEKALRARAVQQDQALRAREAALQARETELTSKAQQDLSNYISKDELKRNAYGKLTELGLTYDELTQQAIASQSPEAQYYARLREEMQDEIRQVREEQAKSRQTFEEQQTAAYQQAVNQIKSEVNQLVKTDPSYETIKATGSMRDVVELIEKTFQEDGTLLTVEQAADAVEDYLVEEALKLAGTKKVQSRLGSMKSQSSSTPVASGQSQQANQMKTLTNAVSNTRPLSAKERAIAAFKGQLK